jgi:hypothetical protein
MHAHDPCLAQIEIDKFLVQIFPSHAEAAPHQSPSHVSRNPTVQVGGGWGGKGAV